MATSILNVSKVKVQVSSFGCFIFNILLEDTGIWNHQSCRMDSEWRFSVLGGKE